MVVTILMELNVHPVLVSQVASFAIVLLIALLAIPDITLQVHLVYPAPTQYPIAINATIRRYVLPARQVISYLLQLLDVMSYN